MKTVADPLAVSPVLDDAPTIWIARSDGPTRIYSVWRGPRTLGALSELLGTLAANGFPAEVEIESRGCGPVTMTLPELVALGIVVEKRPRHRRVVAGVRSLLEQFHLLPHMGVR